MFLSSSTLGGVCFLRGWECLGEHADFETVAGGTLSILKRSWEQSYHSLNIATDGNSLIYRNFLHIHMQKIYQNHLDFNRFFAHVFAKNSWNEIFHDKSCGCRQGPLLCKQRVIYKYLLFNTYKLCALKKISSNFTSFNKEETIVFKFPISV